MKRSPLRRGSQLARGGSVTRTAPMRRGRMKRGPSTTKHALRERAPEAWWLFVKSQPCFVVVALREFPGEFPFGVVSPCSGGIEADHMGDRFSQGDGTRAHDWTCAGICNGHHQERTNERATGTFRGFTKADNRAFRARAIDWTHARARALGVVIPTC